MPTQAAAGIHRRLAPIVVTEHLKLRFWSGVSKGEESDCWPWTRAMRNGYGAIKTGGRVHQSHRVAYVLTNGEPGDGMLVTHTCDNRSCCNPAHLKAGTPTENNREAHDRGRVDSPRGEQCHNAVLNEKIVVQIWLHRQTKINGRRIGARRISKLMGLKEKTVGEVLVGHTWNHLRPNWADKPQ